MKTSQYHITATPHYYHRTFCSYSYILVVHFTASTILRFTKIRVSWNGGLPPGTQFGGWHGTFYAPPTFSDGGDIICYVPPLFSIFVLYLERFQK